MKKIVKKISFATLMLMVSGMPAMAAGPIADEKGLCKLLESMQGIFSTLRLLAFIGAAFLIAGWAWEIITAGDGKVMDTVKKKGTGLLVGFALLFMVGAILSFLMSQGGKESIGCAQTILANW